MSNSDENDLLDEQGDFIERARISSSLLVAGPGTGKTFTLERASEYLVDEGIDPDQIALLTLTRAMAGSLSERVPHGKAETLHSFALRHLNIIGEAQNRRVADGWETNTLVREDLKLGVDQQFGTQVGLSRVGSYLDKLRKAFRRTQQEPRNLSGVDAQLHQVFQRQREMFRYRLLDELVVDLLEYIERGGDLADPPSYILVDEYQDLNPGELRLLQEIEGQHDSTVVACGDDRQSIYGFRDAEPEGLHQFPKIYDLEQVDYLWKSWRCPQVVCDLAESIADVLPEPASLDRPELMSWPEEEENTGMVRILSHTHPNTEARWVLRECRRLINEEDFDPSDIMIISAGFFDHVFRKLREQTEQVAELPFHLYDPRQRDPVGNEPAMRALGAGLRLLEDDQDQMAWRTLEWVMPGLGEVRRGNILEAGESTYLRSLVRAAEDDAVCAQVVEAGQAVIDRFGEEDVVSITAVLSTLLDYLGRDFQEQNAIHILREEVGEEAQVGSLLTEIRKLSQPDLIDPSEREDGIPVRTVFGAKGLDAPVVFLVNAIEPAFSGWGSVAEGIRRLFVAVTRTESKLYITAPGYIEHTAIGQATEVGYAGLHDLVVDPAREIGIEIENVDSD